MSLSGRFVDIKEASMQSTIDNIEITSSLSDVNLDAIVLLATKMAAAFVE